MSLEVLSASIPQGGTAVYQTLLKNEAGSALGFSALSSLTLTYYDVQTRLILNNREQQDVLNHNHVSVTAAGLLTWVLQPADTVFLGPQVVSGALAVESHMAIFTFTWLSAPELKVGRHEALFFIDAVLF